VPAPDQHSSEDTVTLSTAYRFFVPLIFMTELNMISKSVINAALARTPDQNVTLAAFHVAFTLYFALSSSTEVCAVLTLGYLKTRRALAPLLRFMIVIVALPWMLAQAIAFTALGDWAFGGLFGASDAVVAQAKTTIFLLSLSAPILVTRSICFGLILMHQRTIFITYATVVRLASLGVSLIVLPKYLDGAAVGAAALVICMVIETAVALAFAQGIFRKLPLGTEPGSEAPPSFRQQWRFSWPLMLNTSAEMGVVTTISIFLGLSSRPDLALAAFSIIYGLVSLLMSPMRNLVATAQTLVKVISDRRPIFIFALHLVVFFGLISIVLFHTPLDDFVLVDAMGLKPELREYCGPALKLTFLMSAAWAYSALFRGLLAGAQNTTMLAASGLSRIAVAALISSVSLLLVTANGAVIGLIGWVAGYTAEAGILAFQLRRLDARRARRGDGA
jgi:progressive ankylosis protein